MRSSISPMSVFLELCQTSNRTIFSDLSLEAVFLEDEISLRRIREITAVQAQFMRSY